MEMEIDNYKNIKNHFYKMNNCYILAQIAIIAIVIEEKIKKP